MDLVKVARGISRVSSQNLPRYFNAEEVNRTLANLSKITGSHRVFARC